VIDDEGVQILVVGDGDVQQEVLVAGDDEDAEGHGLARRPVAERLEHLALGMTARCGVVEQWIHGAPESAPLGGRGAFRGCALAETCQEPR
jgi:hypothetical protein